MNRPGKDRTVGARPQALSQNDHFRMLRIVSQIEEGLLRLLPPVLVVAAILLFFTLIYGLVDDLMVAGVVAVIVPMMFLSLFRREGVS